MKIRPHTFQFRCRGSGRPHQLLLVVALLAALAPWSLLAGAQPAAPTAGHPIRLGLYVGEGSSSGVVKQLTKIFAGTSELRMHRLDEADLRPEVLRRLDVLLIPGGYASRQGKAIGDQGRLAVRQFVNDGGGYLGICAGAYLAGSRHPVAFDLIADGKKIDRSGPRKRASGKRSDDGKLVHKQKLQLTDKGKKIFPKQPSTFQIACVAGPTFATDGAASPPNYDVLAVFRTQLKTGRGAVINKAGIVSSQFGDGRVLAISPHPELTRGRGDMVLSAVRWVANRHQSVSATGSAE